MTIPFGQNQVAEIRIFGMVATQQVMNIFHVEADDGAGGPPPPDTNLDNLLDAWIDFWRGSTLPLLTTAYSVVKYEAARVLDVHLSISPTGREIYQVGYVGPIEIPAAVTDVGGLTEDSMSSVTCFGLKKRAVKGTQNLRGGIRIGPRPESATESVGGNPNRWTPAAAALHNNFALDFEADKIASTVSDTYLTRMGVFSRKLASLTPLDPYQGFAELTALSPNPFVTSQVSRKERG